MTTATPKIDGMINELMRKLIGVMVYLQVLNIIYPDLEIRCHKLWIESPSKKTTRQLPFYLALRIVRKHNWHLIDTIPKQSIKHQVISKLSDWLKPIILRAISPSKRGENE